MKNIAMPMTFVAMSISIGHVMAAIENLAEYDLSHDMRASATLAASCQTPTNGSDVVVEDFGWQQDATASGGTNFFAHAPDGSQWRASGVGWAAGDSRKFRIPGIGGSVTDIDGGALSYPALFFFNLDPSLKPQIRTPKLRSGVKTFSFGAYNVAGTTSKIKVQVTTKDEPGDGDWRDIEEYDLPVAKQYYAFTNEIDDATVTYVRILRSQRNTGNPSPTTGFIGIDDIQVTLPIPDAIIIERISVSGADSRIYSCGETVRIAVNFSDTIFSVSGTPLLHLNVQNQNNDSYYYANNHYADYATYSGFSGGTMFFDYMVKPGDFVTDLDVTGFDFNGGYVLFASGANFDYDVPTDDDPRSLASNSDVGIQTIFFHSSASASISQTLEEEGTVSLAVTRGGSATCSQSFSITSEDASGKPMSSGETITYPSSFAIPAGSAVGTFSVTATWAGTQILRLHPMGYSGTDGDLLATFTVTPGAVLPSVLLSGPTSVNEGAAPFSVAVSLSRPPKRDVKVTVKSSKPDSLRITMANGGVLRSNSTDGNYAEITFRAYSTTAYAVTLNPLDGLADGSNNVTLTATASDTYYDAAHDIIVANIAPTASLPAADETGLWAIGGIVTNAESVISWSVGDVAPDLNAGVSATFDFGDGTSTNVVCSGSGYGSVRHIYHSAGAYQASLRITDKDGGSSTYVGKVFVSSGPLKIDTSYLPGAVEREPYSIRLQASGGVEPITWDVVEKGYATAYMTGSFAEEGTLCDWDSYQNTYTNIDLPFAFPLYGKEYNSVRINKYGCLDFGENMPYTGQNGMYWDTNTNYVRIVPFGDWFSPSSDEQATKLWMRSSTESVLFRFSCYGVYPRAMEDFSVELFADGRIVFRYGSDCTSTYINQNMMISAGDGRRYAKFDRNTWNGTDDIVFTPAWVATDVGLPQGLSLDGDGVLSGEVAHYGTYPIPVRATDAEGTPVVKTFYLGVSISENLRPVADVEFSDAIKNETTSPPQLLAPVDRPVSFRVDAHDPEGAAIEYIWMVDGVEAERNATGEFTFTPNLNDYYLHRYDGCMVECLISDGFWTNEVSSVFSLRIPYTIMIDQNCESDYRDGYSWATAYRSFEEIWASWMGDYYYEVLAVLFAPGEYDIPGEFLQSIYDTLILIGAEGAGRTIVRHEEHDWWPELRYAVFDGVQFDLPYEDPSEYQLWGYGAVFKRCILRNQSFCFYNCALSGCLVTGGFGCFDDCQLENCTIAGATASDMDGLIDGGVVRNCIVWDNRTEDGEVLNYPYNRNSRYHPSFMNSCVWPLPAKGTGNIADDPMFVDLDAGDCRLLSESPCRNAGLGDFGIELSKDISGYPRLQGTAVDMGAHEGMVVRLGDAWHSTSGDAPWTTPAVGNPGSGIEARSGEIGDGGESWVDIRAEGPGVLDFRWRVSSERRYDRLSISLDGTAIARISGETQWEPVSVPVPEGSHVVRLSYAKSATGSAGEDAGFVATMSWTPAGDAELSLATALDAEGLAWETDGSLAWRPQREIAFDGVDAVRTESSGERSDGAISARVTGPGTLSFRWLLEPADGICGVEFQVDGDTVEECEDATGWTLRTVRIPEGEHVVRWMFWKDDGCEKAFACLDTVSWTGTSPDAPTETQKTSTPVPLAWLDEKAAPLLASAYGDYEAAANATARNGRPVWECYIADLDPEDEDSELVAEITFDENGKPVVSIAKGESPNRVYTTQGARSLGGKVQWDDLEEGADWAAQGYRFFRVKVELP